MSLEPGTRLGRYEILAPLGAGGMGEVYRARDARLQREVALKVLSAGRAGDRAMLARFEQEARAVAALAHPNILSIFDVGADQGLSYVVTELLEGTTLRGALAGGPLPIPLARDHAVQILQGLAAAHARGFVHRDLKPENLFVTADGHLKILDFGLAKRLDSEPGADPAQVATAANATQPGAVLGTVGYMPPEQLRGESVDARADVFAFGAVLYEMLAGRRAFPGRTWADTTAAVLGADPPDLATLRPDVPPDLGDVVLRCLRKEPAERFASGREVLQALRGPTTASAVETLPTAILPGPRSAAPTARPPRRLARPVLAVALVAAAAVGVGLAVSRGLLIGRPARAPVRARAVAMLDFENLSADRSLDWMGRGLPELLGTALARSAELDVYDPQRLSNLLAGPNGSHDAPASITEHLRAHGVGRAVVGSILRAGAGLSIQCRVVEVETGRVLHSDAAEGPAGSDLFQLAGPLVAKLQTWLEIDLLGSSTGDAFLRQITTSSADAYRLYLRGHAAFIEGRWREAGTFLEQALALDASFVAARVDLTGCYWNLGDEERTRSSLAEAGRLRDRAPPREALQIDLIDAVIGGDAERLVRIATSLRELFPENRFFAYLVGRGNFLAGRWDACVAALEPLVRERWNWAWTYLLAARAYEKLGRLDDARRCFEAGMAVTRKNPELAFAFATFLSAHGDPAGARSLLVEASETPGLSETPEFEARIRLALGKLLEGEGRAGEARTQYEKAAAALPGGSDEKEARERLRRLPAAPR